MTQIAKAGLHINEANEVIGWVNAGDEVDLKNGDSIVSHHKTAEKKGLLDVFNELKAQNAPVKEKKAKEPKEGGRTRVAIPKTGTYTVVKTSLAEGEDCERTRIARMLLENTSFESFWAAAPEKFNHAGRDGVMKEFATSGLVSYAIRRGMITVDA